MAGWIETVEADAIVDGELYFIGMRPVSEHGQWNFWSELKNGKERFTIKTGIAVRFKVCEKLRKKMSEDKRLCCIKVPPNADRKWKARR